MWLQLINLSLTLLYQLPNSTLSSALYQQCFICIPLWEPPIAATLLTNVSASINSCIPNPQKIAGHLPLHSGGHDATCSVTSIIEQPNKFMPFNIPRVINITVTSTASFSSPLRASFLYNYTLHTCVNTSAPGPCVLVILSSHSNIIWLLRIPFLDQIPLPARDSNSSPSVGWNQLHSLPVLSSDYSFGPQLYLNRLERQL